MLRRGQHLDDVHESLRGKPGGANVNAKRILEGHRAGAVGVAFSSASATRSGYSRLPSGGSRMNVILIILDSLRKDHVGVYGSDRVKTPSLDALATQSLRFTQPYPESIPTIPARRAIHTGLRTWPFRNWIPPKGETFFPAGWQPIPEEQTTLSEILSTQGYNTLLVTDTHHLFK